MPKRKPKRKRPTPLILTNSAYTKFNWCERAYYWRYELGWDTVAINRHLDVGSKFHLGANAFMRGQTINQALKAVPANDDNSILARMLIERYYERYSDSRPFRAVCLKKAAPPVAVELTLTMPLAPGLTIAGKIDAVAMIGKDYWLIEHKTASQIDGSYLLKLPLDRQMTLYLMMWNYNHPKMKARGVIYDVIKKPGQRMRVGEIMPDFCDRVAVEYAGAPFTYFAQQKCFRGEQDFDHFKQELIRRAADIKRCRRANSWIQETDKCFIRNRECPYTTLCIEGQTPTTLQRYQAVQPHCELDANVIGGV